MARLSITTKQTVLVSVVGVSILIAGSFVLVKQTLNDESIQNDISKVVANQCQGTALCITEKINRIIDGDTIHLEDGHKVRISLTNTPEIYHIVQEEEFENEYAILINRHPLLFRDSLFHHIRVFC